MTTTASNSLLLPEQATLIRRFNSIFIPYHWRQLLRHFGDRTEARFAHYTSAEAALKILKTKQLWMRNTNCMADFREVEYGISILRSFFSDQHRRKAFITPLDACAPGVADEAFKQFDTLARTIRFHSYISAVSEHSDQEDDYGRLSMWRGFGTGVRVALVFKVPIVSPAVNALKLLFGAVGYLSSRQAHEVLEEVIAKVNSESEFLRSNPSMVRQGILTTLLIGALCVKHAGFHEEKEWRVIHEPKLTPSALVQNSTEVVAGVPQIVYKIPLDKTVSAEIADLDWANIFDRVIIGPSLYPNPIYDAFVPALTQAGVENADQKVIVSDIPLRSV